MSKSRTRDRRQQKEQASRQRNRILTGVGVAAVVIIGAIVLVFRSSQLPDLDPNTVPDESVTFSIAGSEHIPVGSPRPAYNSNPPTSGDHYDQAVRAQVYTQELPDENLVHNLEHGHIWLSYQDETDTATIDTLTEIQSQFPAWVVVSHRPENDDPVVAAAWGRMLPMEEADADAITAFILRYRNQAPESIPG